MPRKKRVPDTTPVEEAPTLRPPWHGFALVRIRHPTLSHHYYRQGGADPWVTTGYNMWDIEVWKSVYLKSYEAGDGRNWDFFGEVIDIWEGTDPDHK